MKNTMHADDMFQVAQTLSTKIQQASWINKNKPHVQWPWVVGYMESLFKNLPRTEENLEYLQESVRTLDRLLAECS